MLHLVNGGATLKRLAPLALPGTLLVWNDILVEGPVRPRGPGRAEWQERGAVLERRLGIPAAAYAEGMARCQAALEEAGPAGQLDEVVLWFEEDLFCQVHLAHLLDRLDPGLPTSLICPETPLGRRAPEDLAQLFRARAPVTPGRRALARELVEAFARSDPSDLEALRSGPLNAWPRLQAGLTGHARRFPALRDGLSLTERVALAALVEGPRPFGQAFARLAADPVAAALGYTDLQLRADLAELATGPAPLVQAADGQAAHEWGPHATGPVAPAAPTLELTALGREVVAGRQDRAHLVPLDRWLGGVHLSGPRPAWRWDDTRGEITPG